jgi:hypothetical protein
MKLKETVATLTYTSETGYYVISQPEVCAHTGDTIYSAIVLSPEQMRLIIVDMEAKLLSADEWWSIQDTEGEE